MTPIEQWTQALAELFPSSDIEQPFDIAAAVYRAYENGDVRPIQAPAPFERAPRRYLGASGLGQECARKAWGEWRKLGDGFDGRMLRLFRTGDVYELRMRAELRAIGFEMYGDQARFEAFGGRVAGHTDGFARLLGLPPALWEGKTANHRRCTNLIKLLRDEDSAGAALRAWDAKYYGQIQSYMAAFGLSVCLYCVTDKNTDTLVAFLVERDDDAVREVGRQARQILTSDGPPARGFERPQTPLCTRFCDFAEWCWHGADLPKTCGACVHWQDGICARTGNAAVDACDHFESLPTNSDDTVTEWEAL